MSYAVLGYGRSSKVVIEYLLSKGEEDIVLYLPQKEWEVAKKDYLHIAIRDLDAPICEGVIVRSPGLRPDRENIMRAKANGSRLTQEVEMFLGACPALVYGVTGSDGKTTTATLASKMLEAEGNTVWLGGNIGTPPLTFLNQVTPRDKVVLELSSFQLMTFAPHLTASAVTNLTPNHLNWHRDLDEYTMAKRHILLHAARRVQNAHSMIAPELSSITFSVSYEGANYHLKEGKLYRGDTILCDTGDILLPGMHNYENMLCAAALTGASGESVRDVATTFRGVHHRMEYGGEIGGRHCYNSSIDTTPSRTAVTLAAIPYPMTIICGGYDKHLSMEPLTQALMKYGARVVFTGGNGKDMMAHLTSHPAYEGTPSCRYIAPFSEAVQMAYRETPVGEAVVLSPAAASFDAFSSYEERGEAFCQIFGKMKSAFGG